MKKITREQTLFLVLLTCLMMSASAFAGEGISLNVQVVYASSGKVFVDPALVTLKKKLSRLFNYSSYETVTENHRLAVRGETAEFSLPGGRMMKIVPLETGKNSARLNVQIFIHNRGYLNTVLRMRRGSLMMVGGPSYQNGVLIIVISAQ